MIIFFKNKPLQSSTTTSSITNKKQVDDQQAQSSTAILSNIQSQVTEKSAKCLLDIFKKFLFYSKNKKYVITFISKFILCNKYFILNKVIDFLKVKV